MRRAGTRVRTPALVAGLLALVLAVTGCGSSGRSDEPTTLTVYAASSLTGVFTELGQDFEAEHPGVRVDLSFAGSADLAAQIREGAPADVFAAADEATMSTLTREDLVSGDPVLFAANSLEIAVAPGNPEQISSLSDLADPGLVVVVCAPEVPCGAAAQVVTEAAGVRLTPASEEQKVTDVLAKVAVGEADAGLVYVTEVQGSDGAVDGVTFPEAAQAVTRYPIGVLAETSHHDLAGEFVDLVLSEPGQQVLTGAGFRPAP